MDAPGGVSRPGRGVVLSAAQRRWLWINAIAIPAVINASSSALIAWLSLQGEHKVPVWSRPLVDPPGLVTDSLGTFFVLPFLTTIGIAFASRAAIRNGQVQPVTLTGWWLDISRRLPDGLFLRALLLAIAVVVSLGPVAIAVLSLLNFHPGIDPLSFVIYKAALGVVLGGFFTPFIAILSLTGADLS